MDLLASSLLITTPSLVSKDPDFCFKCQCLIQRKTAWLTNNIRVQSQARDSSAYNENEEYQDEEKEGLEDASTFSEGSRLHQMELGDDRNKSRSIQVTRSDIVPSEEDEGSNVEVLSGPKYVMSSPVVEGSSQIALVRAEIERRVTEQLLKNQAGLHPLLSIQGIIENTKPTSLNEREEGNLEIKHGMQSTVVPDEDFSYRVMDLQPQSDSIVTTGNDSDEVQSENSISVPNALYDQMVGNYEREIVHLRDQLLHVNKELDQQQKLMGVINEKLTKDIHELSDKIFRLLDETIGREDVNRMNDGLKRNFDGLQSNFNRMQHQITSAASTLETLAQETVKSRQECEQSNTDVQLELKKFTERLNRLEIMQDSLASKAVHVEVRNVADVVSNIEQKQQRFQMHFNKMESHVESCIREMKDYMTEIDQRGRILELSDGISKIVNKVDRENKLSQSCIGRLSDGLNNNETNIQVLQEEWRQFREEVISTISELKNELSSSAKTSDDLQLEDLQKELSDIKNVVITLKEEVKFNRDSALEAEKKVSILEAKSLEINKQIMEDAEIKQQELLDDVRRIVAEAMLKNKENLEVNEDGVALISDDKTIYPPNDNNDLSINKDIQLTIHTQTFLESLFAVIGQVIRQELERMNADPNQPSLLPNIAGSGDADPKNMANKNTITLLYKSEWRTTFLHYCADNTRWTEIPGVPMEYVVFNGKQMKMMRVTANRMEFVLTDGQGNWDKGSDGCNYVIEGPGVFELSEGIVKIIYKTQQSSK